MRLVTYRFTVDAAARLGAIVDDLVVDIEDLGEANGVDLPDNMLDFIALGPLAVAKATALLKAGDFPVGSAVPLANVKLLAPIPRPTKNIFGIGLNYIDHVAESPEQSTPLENLLLLSGASALVGANSTFSWWAAFLGERAEGSVVFPRPLFGPAGPAEPRDWLLPGWVQVGAA